MKTANQSIITIALAALAASFATSASAAGPTQAAGSHHTVVPADAVQWGPVPPSLLPGAQAAVLLGNPAEKGPFVLRLRFPAGYAVPPHRHSTDELITVLAGTFMVGTGEKIDRASGQPLTATGFVHLPAGMPHYAWAEGETAVQINGTGPFDVIYLIPHDDPRKQ